LGNVSWRGSESIAQDLALLILKEAEAPVSQRKEITLSPDVLAKYVGTYEIAPSVNVYIRLENGQLTEELTGQRRTKIYAESETKFFSKGPDVRVDFIKNDKGEIARLTAHQYGKDREAIRTSSIVAERTEIQLPGPTLAQYVGKYQLPGLVLAVTLEGDRLVGHIPGQDAFPMFAEARDRFFLRVVDARIDFVRDGQDAVTELVLHQGPRDERGPRMAR
jgi:hypothetical protein